MSGGQRQRVAIGRAIIRSPKVFLFDEPLSNLDAKLRVHTRFEISQLHKNLKATMIYVTHDQVEAMTMADKIVVMNAGRVEQVGTPIELYNRPANIFVAGFIGSPAMNFFTVDAAGAGTDARLALVGGGAFTLTGERRALAPSIATIGIRPEHLQLAEAGGDNTIESTVTLTEKLGSVTQAYLQHGSGPILLQLPGQRELEDGARLRVRLPEAAVHLFDASGRRLDAGPGDRGNDAGAPDR
jgi:ABC-type sugar transport system ATPase subunit